MRRCYDILVRYPYIAGYSVAVVLYNRRSMLEKVAPFSSTVTQSQDTMVTPVGALVSIHGLCAF
ncbi:hypothetical protein [Nitrosomonas sp. Nm51]|uniref:hypothetical protein n=1 Tax=Nitrosomonas sp. Nm51 TaxID=133720 RepID=UPI00115FF3CC|nr:hypothetical protein [Nitrosomonas sp. Nm51]